MRHVGVSLYRREFSGTIPSHVGQYCAAHKYVTRLRHAQSRIHVTVSHIGGGGRGMWSDSTLGITTAQGALYARYGMHFSSVGSS